jgi:hypothetical protein
MYGTIQKVGEAREANVMENQEGKAPMDQFST